MAAVARAVFGRCCCSNSNSSEVDDGATSDGAVRNNSETLVDADRGIIARFGHNIINSAQKTHGFLRRWCHLPAVLPGEWDGERLTLVLDLDETLIHTTTTPSLRSPYELAYSPHLILDVAIAGQQCSFYVFVRPYLREFLRQISKWYNVMIFTASEKRYAEPLIERLDRDGVISRCFFRPSCTQRGRMYIKDLTKVCPDLARVAILDNSPIAYAFHAGELPN